MKYTFSALIILSFFFVNQVHAQDSKADSLMNELNEIGEDLLSKEVDTSYVEKHNDDFNVKLYSISKFNFFRLQDKDKSAGVWYRPTRQLNLGVGLAYKWFALDLAFNFGIREETDIEHSRFLDFQGNVFSDKQIVEAVLQYYYGYQLIRNFGFDVPEDIEFGREDVRTVFLGLQYYFALNYDKFSLKAPFILNEIQKKSAGSWVIGAGFRLYSMDADSSLAPIPEIDPEDFPVTGLTNLNFSAGFGYIHSFSIKKYFFITIGIIPELCYNMGDYRTDYNRSFKNNLSYGFTSLNAIGYNGVRFFTGLQFMGDLIGIGIDDYLMNVGNGKAKFFVGYRFKKKEKKTPK